MKIDGLLPVRIRDLPVSFTLGLTVKAYVVVGDKTPNPRSLRAAWLVRPLPFKEFPLNVELPLVTETRAPRDGYTKVDVDERDHRHRHHARTTSTSATTRAAASRSARASSTR